MKRRPRVEWEDGLQEVVDLWTAPTADALHRVLVLHPPMRGTFDAYEPLALLKRHHETEPESSPSTAVLLLTDRRWRNAAAHLVRRIEASGALSLYELDVLARSFTCADEAVFWPVPDAWFTGGIEIDLGFDSDDDAPGDLADSEVVEGPAVARREIAPPLRRWAVAYVVAREPAAWSALLARTKHVNARAAAAIVAGLLDGAGNLPPAAQAFLIERGVTWPDKTVRQVALGLVAARDGVEVAARLGLADRNAGIREWAAKLGAAPPPPSPTVALDCESSGSEPAAAEQPALF